MSVFFPNLRLVPLRSGVRIEVCIAVRVLVGKPLQLLLHASHIEVTVLEVELLGRVYHFLGLHYLRLRRLKFILKHTDLLDLVIEGKST